MLYFALFMTKELSTEEKFAALSLHIEYLQSEYDRLKECLAKYENPKNSKNRREKAPDTNYLQNKK